MARAGGAGGNFKDLAIAKLRDEAVEAAMRNVIAKGLREAVDSGMSGKRAAAFALLAPFRDNSPIMQVFSPLPGFARKAAYAALSSVLGSFLQREVTKLLPTDNRPGVREAKILIGMLPHFAIGAVEGITDVSAEIDRQLDTLRSDSGSPDLALQDAKIGDVLFECDELPGRLFVASPTSDGKIRFGADGVPMVYHPEWLRVKAVWDRDHQATTRREPGRNGQPERIIQVPAKPWKNWHAIPMADAMARIESGQASISQSDIEKLQALFRKPAEWWDEVGSKVRWFFLILTRSLRHQGLFKYTIREDLLKDIVDKKGIAFLQQLADFYNPRMNEDKRFKDADVEDIMAALDTMLGAELTFFNRAWRMAVHAWENRARVGWGTVAKAWFTVFFLLLMSAAYVSTLAAAVVSVGIAVFAPLTEPLMGSVDPRYPAIGLLVSGTIYIVVMLTLFRVFQTVLSPIANWLKFPAEWLTNYGRKLTFVFVVLGFVFAVAIVIQSSFWIRILIVAFAMMRLGIVMMLEASGFPATAKNLKRRGALYGWIALLTALFVDLVIRNWLMINPKYNQIETTISSFVSSNPLVAGMLVVLLITVVAVVALGIAKKKLYIWPLAIVLSILVLVVFIPFVVQAYSNWTADEPAAAAAPTALPAPAPTPTVTTAPLAPAPAPVPTVRRRTPPRHYGHTHSRGFDCANVPLMFKAAAGCN